MSAENISAFMPRPSASQSMVIPRTSGIFWMTPPYRCFGNDSEVTTMDLSGARTATDMNVRPRIMTPSRTAWPPYEIFGVRRVGVWPGCSTGAEALIRSYLLLFRVLQAALEALDLARRIDEALLTGKERVTCGTHVDMQVLLGRARLPRVAATTRNCGQFVFGMDARLHLSLRSWS